MRKITLALLLFCFLFASLVTTTFAQTNRDVKRAEIEQRIEERKKLIEEKKLEIQKRVEVKKASAEARLSENRIEKIRAYWQRLKTRLLAAVERIERLVERIESRLAKVEEGSSDSDTTSINDDLEKAKALLSDASVKIETADELVEDALASQNPKEAFKVVRNLVKDIKEDLVEVHRLLVHLIGDIRGLRVGQGKNVEVEVSVTSAPTVTLTPSATVTPVPTL